MPKFRFHQSHATSHFSPRQGGKEGGQARREGDPSWANSGPMSESWALAVWSSRVTAVEVKSGSVPAGLLGCVMCGHLPELRDLRGAGLDASGPVACPSCGHGAVVVLPPENGEEPRRDIAARRLRFLYQRFLIWRG